MKNRYGIYYFQYRLPQHFQTSSNSNKLFRISLGTKIRREALKQSRRWSIAMDELTKRFFGNPEAFGQGMKLLMQYKEREKIASSWEAMEEFLMNLDDSEDLLLNQAISYNIAGSNEKSEIKIQNELLSKTIELLSQKSTKHSVFEGKPAIPTLKELIDTYWNEYKVRLDSKHLNTNERDIIPKLALFVETIGNKPSNEMRKEDIVRYKTVMLNYPSNKNKKAIYQNLSIQDILEKDIPAEDRISSTTIKNHFTKISSFLTWCENNYSHIAKDLKNPLKNTIKRSSPANQDRDAFSDDDLKKLFESEQYTKGLHSCAAHYWIPLLALFTGARENELCQLHKNDIYLDDRTNTWVINFNAEGNDKKLKKQTHQRIVPIHKQLLKLDFVKFINHIKNERIFPELKPTTKGHGDAFSKWFNRTYRNKSNCNVGQGSNEKKNFHSFRHTFITQLVNKHGIDQTSIARLVGQKPNDDSVTINRYTKDRSIQENNKIINKINYQVDFQKIKKWNEQLFYRTKKTSSMP